MACRSQQEQQPSSGSGSRDGGGGGGGSSKRQRTTRSLHLAALRGRYELVSVRGKGCFAEVWEARHLRTGHRVAIKILCHAANKPSKVEREIRVMRLLRHHPHVARFYEAIVADEHTYIVMELAESGQLYDHVAVQERLPEAEARRIFQQLVAGVLYCHRNMVVHRDLKMENVLLDSERNVKIVDLGFSKLFWPRKLVSKRRGSPEYAAPELYSNQSSSYVLGPEVDVWSCGVILYGMFCGRLPFDGIDIPDLRRNITRGEYRLPAWVSDDARDLISSMLIVRPDKRATMAEVRAHRWLQPDMPPYLLLPATAVQVQAQHIDAATVELLVTRHGFERSSQLLESIVHHEDDTAVSYQLVLSKQYDAATRYLQLSMPPPPQQQHAIVSGGRWALVMGGLDGELLLVHECPRETMRRIARALKDLGVRILFNHSHRRRHWMVCRGSSGGGRRPAAAATATDDAPPEMEMDKNILDNLVFFEIQLFNKATGYAVHPKRTSGPQLGYLRICSQLASKLKSSDRHKSTHHRHPSTSH